MEEFILIDRDRENTYRKRYENLKKKSLIIETSNFSEEQSETFKDKEKLEKLSQKKDIHIYTKNYEKKLKEYGNNSKIDIINRELFEGFIIGDTFILTDRELDGSNTDRRLCHSCSVWSGYIQRDRNNRR